MPCPAWQRDCPGGKTLAGDAARLTLQVCQAPSAAIVDITLTDDAAQRTLNRTWRGKDAPTNVLAFPAGDPAARAERASGVASPRAAVVEVPLLFEAGQEGIYDATIVVIADEAVRRARAADRGHASLDERAARQLSQQEKAARATFVVRNDGSERDLERQLSSVLDKLGR